MVGPRAIIGAVAGLLCAAGVAVAFAPAAPVLHPRWRVVGHGGEATNGRYTMLLRFSEDGGTLLDERTGRRTGLRLLPGCRAPTGAGPMLGDGWLLLECGQTRLALFSLSSHRWRSVAIALACADLQDATCVPAAVGARWIEYDESSTRLGDRFVFQSIATGAVRADPRNATTLADLDSPGLARRVCRPLRVPPRTTLKFAGGGFVLATDESGGAVLERCGTRLHLRLPSVFDVAAGPSAVVWLQAPNRPLAGLLLPSLRRFTVALPRRATDVVWVDLAGRHIYLVGLARGDVNDVWSAPAPAP